MSPRSTHLPAVLVGDDESGVQVGIHTRTTNPVGGWRDPAPNSAGAAPPAARGHRRQLELRPCHPGFGVPAWAPGLGYHHCMAHRVTLIPGDGIGPELAEATRRVLDASGVAFEWEVQDAGEGVMAQYGTPLPEHVLESIRRNKIAIKGPITTPVGTGFRSVNVTLRQTLGLYANLRPARSIQGLETRYENVDLVIVRENTEDLYAGIEHKVGPDAAESIKIITRAASERIARFAFEYAVANGRKKVTAVHKANIMKLSDGLFLESCATIAKDYEGRIEFEDRIVDNMCMQLVQKPELYDVMVLPNLYGDIVSDLCAGLVGGLGVAPGANIGVDGAVFEPVHGSAPKYAGQNKANPTAMILSGVLMLRHLGEQAAAERVEDAVRVVIAEGTATTYDLGGPAGTSEFADAIVARLG
jgi:isocitrate dehydrogenase (NAD+)